MAKTDEKKEREVVVVGKQAAFVGDNGLVAVVATKNHAPYYSGDRYGCKPRDLPGLLQSGHVAIRDIARVPEKVAKAATDKKPRKVPTLEEVIKAGYAEDVAVGIVAQEKALAGGASDEDARKAGEDAQAAFLKEKGGKKSPQDPPAKS